MPPAGRNGWSLRSGARQDGLLSAVQGSQDTAQTRSVGALAAGIGSGPWKYASDLPVQSGSQQLL